MSVVVAKLMAEIGINTSGLTAGLKKVRQDVVDTAKTVAEFNKIVEQGNDKVTASNARVLASEKDLQKQKEVVEIAVNNQTKAENALTNAIERRQRMQRSAERYQKVIDSPQFATMPSELQLPIRGRKAIADSAVERNLRSEENAQLSLQNATLRTGQAQRELTSATEKLNASQAKAAQIEKELAAAAIEEAAAKEKLTLMTEELQTSIIGHMQAQQKELLVQREVETQLGQELTIKRMLEQQNILLAESETAAYLAQRQSFENELLNVVTPKRQGDREAARIAEEEALAQKAAQELEKSRKVQEAQAQKVLASIDSAGRKAREVGQQLSLAITLPLTILGGVSVKAANEYEFRIGKITGLTNASTADINKWSEAMLHMEDTGKAPKELAEGMFFVASAGFQGSKALEILNESAKAAETGLGDVGIVSRTVSGMIYNYGEKNLSAAHATDVLTGIIREGKVPVDAIAQSFARVLPITAQMGISIEDTGAAIASMTRAHIPAERAVTALTTAFTKIMVGGPQISKALKEIGLTVEDVTEMLRPDKLGVFGTFDLLEKKEEAQGKSLANLFQTSRSVAGILSIVGRNAESNSHIFERMNNINGASAKAWDSVKDTAKVALDQMTASASTAEIAIGKVLSPTVVRLSKFIVDLSDSFTNLPKDVQEAVVGIGLFAAVVGPAVYLTGQLTVSLVTLTKLSGLLSTISTYAASVGEVGIATEAAEIATVGLGASFAAVLVPAGVALGVIAAIGLAVWGLKYAYDSYMDVGEKTPEQLKKEAEETRKLIAEKIENNDATKKLTQEYFKLAGVHDKTAAEAQRIKDIFDKLTALNPQLTQGYNSQGERLDFLRDKMINFLGSVNDVNNSLKEQQRIMTLAADIGPQKESLENKKLEIQNKLNELLDKGLETSPAKMNMPSAGYYPQAAEHTKSGEAYSKAIAEQNVALEGVNKELENLRNLLSETSDNSKGLTKVNLPFGLSYKLPSHMLDPEAVKRTAPETKVKIDPHIKDQAIEILKGIGNGIKTTEGKAACADFASQVMKQAGLEVPHTMGAKALTDYVASHGTKVSQENAQALDLVSIHGSGYGAIQPNGQRSGYHVGVYLGNGQMMDDTGGGHHARNLSSFKGEKSFYHMEGGAGTLAQSLKEGKGEASEATKEYEKYKGIITELYSKHEELSTIINTTGESTKAQALAFSYAKENAKNFNGELDESAKKALALVKVQQHENVLLQAKADHVEAIRKIQLLVDGQKDKNSISYLNDKDKEMVEAFGTKNWFNKGIPNKMRSDFSEAFFSAKDEENTKELPKLWDEITKSQDEARKEFSKELPETFLDKVNAQLKTFLKDITSPDVRGAIENTFSSLIDNARSLDERRKFVGNETLNQPIISKIGDFQSWKRGISPQEERVHSITEFKNSHEKELNLLSPEDRASTLSNVGKSWDLERSTGLIKEFKTQMFDISHQADIMKTLNPFDKWAKSFERYDAVTNTVKNPLIEQSNAAGVNLRDMFDSKNLDEVNQKLKETQIETQKALALISTASPFKQWLTQYQQFNEVTGQFETSKGTNVDLLSKMFDFQKNMEMMKEFTTGTKDLFHDMLYNIAGGSKVTFGTIYDGFKNLLFKMAVDYESSQVYNGLFKLLSGSSLVDTAGAISNGTNGGSGGVGLLPGVFSSSAIGGGAILGSSGIGSSVTGGGGSSSSGANSSTSHMTVFNVHYHIPESTPQAVRSTVSQSTMDLQKLSARKQTRLGS